MITHSPEETKTIAADFAATLAGGEIVALEGDLGAGKTTFVQGLAEALGIKEPVRSPTFAVMNVYAVPGTGVKELVHLDLYRLKTPDDITNLGLDEWLGRSDTVVVIEWPRAVTGIPVEPTHDVRFDTDEENRRVIEIVPRG